MISSTLQLRFTVDPFLSQSSGTVEKDIKSHIASLTEIVGKVKGLNAKSTNFDPDGQKAGPFEKREGKSDGGAFPLWTKAAGYGILTAYDGF